MREFEAARDRRFDEADRDITIAWYVAALSRQEKLPELNTLLAKRGRKQTPAEQREVLRLLSKRYGIPLREVRH